MSFLIDDILKKPSKKDNNGTGLKDIPYKLTSAGLTFYLKE